MSQISIDYVSLEKAISTLEALAPRVRELAEYHGKDFERAVKADLSSGSASGDVSPMFAPAMQAAQAGIERWVAAMTAQAAHIETLASTLAAWRDAARAGDSAAVAEIERVSATLSSSSYRTTELEDPDPRSFELEDPDPRSFELEDPDPRSFELEDPDPRSTELEDPVRAVRWVKDLDGTTRLAPAPSTP